MNQFWLAVTEYGSDHRTRAGRRREGEGGWIDLVGRYVVEDGADASRPSLRANSVLDPAKVLIVPSGVTLRIN